MSQIARDAGLGREGLYKALSAEGNPEFATIMKVIAALGLCAAVAFHQQQHIKGDRETALARWVVLKCCGHELIESP